MNKHVVSRRAALAGGLATLAVARGTAINAQSTALASLVSAAKAEGSVVVDGPANDGVREALVRGFQTAYGIPVSYISSGASASAARVRAERSAGKYLLDIFVSGVATPTLSFLPAGWLDKVEPVLIAPDVLDKRRWKDGHLWFEDDDHTILRTQSYVTPEVVINTKLIKPGEVTTWKALLDPKWQGKLIAKDPAVAGAGESLISYLYLQFGADFVKRLFVDQKPVLSRDARQAAQWVAQGNYPILLGPDASEVLHFQGLGYPVQPVFPTDGPGILSGGWGLICLLNKAPHPNAAKLFVNWLAGAEAQKSFAKAALALSLRTDIQYADMPSWLFPQKSKAYVDTYAYKYVAEQRDAALKNARALLGE